MFDSLLFMAKIAALSTAAEFVLAMPLYFRKNKVKPKGSALWSILALATVAVHVYVVWTAKSAYYAMLIVALFCFLMANGLFWWAVTSHADQRPNVVFGADVAQKLVTHGAYRRVRHPFYLAYVIGFFGSACVALHWAQFATTLVVFLFYNHAAAIEERLLMSDASHHGAEYAAYTKRSWRWLPFVW
jgi:protein-S-isoprenylcysteine O-methyltransferase Ste14